MPQIHLHREKGENFHIKANNFFKANNVTETIVQSDISKLKILIDDYLLTRYDIYIFGEGGKTKEFYQYFKIKSGEDFQLISSFSILPSYLFFLDAVSSSYAGLIKLSNKHLLEEMFEEVVSDSMASIYFINKEESNDFQKEVMEKKSAIDFETVLIEKSDYFIYSVDGDNGESSTGFVKIVAVGKKYLMADKWISIFSQ